MMDLSVEDILAAAEPYLSDPDNKGIADGSIPQENAIVS